MSTARRHCWPRPGGGSAAVTGSSEGLKPTYTAWPAPPCQQPGSCIAAAGASAALPSMQDSAQPGACVRQRRACTAAVLAAGGANVDSRLLGAPTSSTHRTWAGAHLGNKGNKVGARQRGCRCLARPVRFAQRRRAMPAAHRRVGRVSENDQSRAAQVRRCGIRARTAAAAARQRPCCCKRAPAASRAAQRSGPQLQHATTHECACTPAPTARPHLMLRGESNMGGDSRARCLARSLSTPRTKASSPLRLSVGALNTGVPWRRSKHAVRAHASLRVSIAQRWASSAGLG